MNIEFKKAMESFTEYKLAWPDNFAPLTSNEEWHYRRGYERGYRDGTILDNISFMEEMRTVLGKVKEAYQGVGDFEGTGENMTIIIEDVKRMLQKYEQIFR